ncbi:hypothetical protein MSAR_06000 [Mycolicibacterium sarraceniae]|uniref:Uncharacterized protein n=1 Tax=Mycolicibacterium sarraceniae TaxID=1534348 RepID=A0A7I7SKF2_9MYCO|nr:hypothetical protein MSAR_06000 [Mycolicibacterium sarraceniae]
MPDVVREWRDTHPDEAIPDGLVLTQPLPVSSSEKARGIADRAIHCQYRHDRARRTPHGIDEQIAKAQRVIEGHGAVKRNRFITLSGARVLASSSRLTLLVAPGWKGYTTNLVGQPATFVIDAYHQLCLCGTPRQHRRGRPGAGR